MIEEEGQFGPQTTLALGGTVELTENWREYTYPDAKVRITFPRTLAVSRSGNHRIQDETGNLHIVAPGWVHIEINDGGNGWTV